MPRSDGAIAVETAPDAKPSKGRSWIFLAVLVLGLGGALLGIQRWGQSTAVGTPQSNTRAHEPLLPAVGAYLEGGQPMVDGPARAVFQTALPDFVIALDSWGRGSGTAQSIAEDMQQARAALAAAVHEASLPGGIRERFDALISTSLRAASESDEAMDKIADTMIQQTLSLNEAIASAGLGFLVDIELLSHGRGRRSVLLFTFEIERVVLYRSGGRDVRTLRVRRLDTLNWSYSLLGFTTPKRLDAVVLDNKIDEHLLELLPALAKNFTMDPFHLGKKETYTPWFTETRKLATTIIAEELGTAGDADLVGLGALLARRSEIYSDWNEKLESRNMSISVPRTLEISWPYRQQMEGLVTHGAMDELDGIQEKLSSKRMLTAYALVHDHFAQSVERHEVQHRLDLAKLYTLPMPPSLASYVGELPEGYQGESGLRSSALAETSAYLSELARDPLTPRLNLTLLTGYLLSESTWGTAESYAALIIIEGLAAQLGIAHPPIVVARRIQRDVVADIYQKVAKLGTAKLREASASLWADYFGRELPVLELIAR